MALTSLVPRALGGRADASGAARAAACARRLVPTRSSRVERGVPPLGWSVQSGIASALRARSRPRRYQTLFREASGDPLTSSVSDRSTACRDGGDRGPGPGRRRDPTCACSVVGGRGAPRRWAGGGPGQPPRWVRVADRGGISPGALSPWPGGYSVSTMATNSASNIAWSAPDSITDRADSAAGSPPRPARPPGGPAGDGPTIDAASSTSGIAEHLLRSRPHRPERSYLHPCLPTICNCSWSFQGESTPKSRGKALLDPRGEGVRPPVIALDRPGSPAVASAGSRARA